jgi:hypothetical protein
MTSIRDPAIGNGSAFRTAVYCFGEAGYTIRLFQPPPAHRRPTFSAYNFTGTICRVLLIANMWIEGHFVNFPFDLLLDGRRPETHDAALAE